MNTEAEREIDEKLKRRKKEHEADVCKDAYSQEDCGKQRWQSWGKAGHDKEEGDINKWIYGIEKHKEFESRKRKKRKKGENGEKK